MACEPRRSRVPRELRLGEFERMTDPCAEVTRRCRCVGAGSGREPSGFGAIRSDPNVRDFYDGIAVVGSEAPDSGIIYRGLLSKRYLPSVLFRLE
jgi:hypothetical protein